MAGEIEAWIKADQDWRECVLRVGRKETSVFESHSEAYLESVIVLNARRHLMVWIYSMMKGWKLFKPIEELDRGIKEKMWRFVKEVCAGKTNDIKRMVEVAKTFYVIEYFINESNAGTCS